MTNHPNYSFRKIDDKYIVSIANHSEISNTITQFCSEQNVKLGVISGIGAVNVATLRFFNPVTKEYVDKSFEEQMEIANLTGNISQLDGNIYIHLHVILGRANYSSIAGHLLSANISGAGEFVVEEYRGEIERCFDPNIGLNIYNL